MGCDFLNINMGFKIFFPSNLDVSIGTVGV